MNVTKNTKRRNTSPNGSRPRNLLYYSLQCYYMGGRNTRANRFYTINFITFQYFYFQLISKTRGIRENYSHSAERTVISFRSFLHHNKKITHSKLLCVIFLAGAEGIEPSSGVLETLILPMNYAPTK